MLNVCTYVLVLLRIAIIVLLIMKWMIKNNKSNKINLKIGLYKHYITVLFIELIADV